MPYTAVLTREDVTVQGDQYIITIRCVINDGVDDVFDHSLAAKYKTGDDIEGWKRDILHYFRQYWDAYVDAKAMFEHPALLTAVAELQTAANDYL